MLISISFKNKILINNINMNKMLTVDNLVITLLVLVAAFLAPNLPYSSLQVLDLAAFRVAAMVVVVLVCLYKPVYALLLAIILVVCLQRLHNLKKHNLVLNANQLIDENNLGKVNVDFGNDEEGNDDEGNDEGVSVESNDGENNMNNGVVNNGVINDHENVVLSPVEEGGMTNVNYNLKPIESTNEINNEDAYNNVDQLEVHVIGALLNEGFENPLNNTDVDNAMSVENTSSNNVNNVLTANVPVTDPVNTLNNVANMNNVAACQVKTTRKLFTNSNPCTDTLTTADQLRDVQTNMFSCEGSILSSKNQSGTQGRNNNSGINGYDSKYY
jgi:membrane protein implicated in regulation of membrane protease activity